MNPLKSGQSVRTQWNAVNDNYAYAQFRGHEMISTRERQEAAARNRGLDDTCSLFAPFKIYSFPSVWRAVPAITTDWLKFRIYLGCYNNVVVSGCDRTDATPGTTNYVPDGPDSQVFPSESGTDFTGTEYTLPAGIAQSYFWIDATSASAPAIKWGYAGSVTSGLGGTPASQGWTTFPAPDATHIPIGWVDTQTDAATYWAHTRQLLRHDNPSSGGGTSLQQFKIVSDGGDYWICNTWDGTTQGTININIIKPPKLRAGTNGITGATETIAGVTNSYAYSYTPVTVGSVTAYYTRTVSWSGSPTAETNFPNPVPIAGDVIYAMPCSTNICHNIPVTIASAVVAAGGSGYAVSDVITVSGGTIVTGAVAAQFTVTAVSAGVVTGVTLLNGGNYATAPSNPASTTGGAGTLCQLTLTTAPQLLEVNSARDWTK